MNNLIFLLLLWFTKLISFLISFFHIGQASNFPGKVVLKIKKDLLQSFNIQKDCKIILVTGTNGKSTTCGLIANILKTSSNKVLYNKSGANLLSGIVSSFCHHSDFFGNLNYKYIVLEIDEATLPSITSQLNPALIIVTNLFRDQLDRFGELDTTAKLIEKGINNSKDAIVILNADDKRTAFLNIKNRKIYFGIDDRDTAMQRLYDGQNPTNNTWLSDPEEVTTCPKCSSSLLFTSKFLAHLGNYKCSKCDFKRPELNFSLTDYKTDGFTTNFHIVFNDEDKNHKNNFFTSMIGVFNLYNAICAIAVTKTISQTTNTQIQKGFNSYQTIFGRGEKLNLKNKAAWIYLIKNPTGTTEVLKTLINIPNARFLIAINDNYADGRDVSWLWDAHFDILSNHKKEIFISGKRAPDMALRLKYASINPNQIKTSENIKAAINTAIKSIEKEETLYILPTYTVLLEMQKKGFCKSLV